MGIAPTGKRRLVTAHTRDGHSLASFRVRRIRTYFWTRTRLFRALSRRLVVYSASRSPGSSPSSKEDRRLSQRHRRRSEGFMAKPRRIMGSRAQSSASRGGSSLNATGVPTRSATTNASGLQGRVLVTCGADCQRCFGQTSWPDCRSHPLTAGCLGWTCPAGCWRFGSALLAAQCFFPRLPSFDPSAVQPVTYHLIVR